MVQALYRRVGMTVNTDVQFKLLEASLPQLTTSFWTPIHGCTIKSKGRQQILGILNTTCYQIFPKYNSSRSCNNGIDEKVSTCTTSTLGHRKSSLH